MVIKRTVILPSKGGAFGRVVMPDGTKALVLNKAVHEKALKAASTRLRATVREIKSSDAKRVVVR